MTKISRTQLRALETVYAKQLQVPEFKNLRGEGINFVPGRGILNPKIMIIGKSPGRIENDAARCWHGDSGNYLNSILQVAQIDPRDMFYTNVMKYWARDPESPMRTRPITEREFDAARGFLLDEIYEVNPDIVALCGGSAVQAIFPDNRTVIENHGKLIDGIYVPLFHPSSLKYNPQTFGTVLEGFKALKKHLESLEA